MITNGPSEAQHPNMAATGLAAVFDTEVYAADELRFKPDPHPFERCSLIRDVPHAAVHVGDSFAADIEGTLDLGMDAVWFGEAQHRSDEIDVPDRSGRRASRTSPILEARLTTNPTVPSPRRRVPRGDPRFRPNRAG